MRPGKLDKKLTFQRLSITTDAEGSTVETWADLFTRWSMVNINSASETFKNDQDFNTRGGFIIVRYDSETKTLKENDRFQYLGQYWDIVGIINANQSNEYLEISIRRYGVTSGSH